MIGLQNIIDQIDVIEFIGNASGEILSILPITDKREVSHSLSWVNDKNLSSIYDIRNRTILCSTSLDRVRLNRSCNYIIVNNPRNEFRKVLELISKEDVPTLSPHAVIHPTAKIGNRVSLGPHAVIEENVTIGENSIVGANTVIKKNTVIGNDVKIGSCCVIGGVGFGYERDETGEYVLIPHIGNVVIHDRVEIGNCTTIDRAVIGSTLLSTNCKVDNLVHIAHGVKIGINSLVIANAMVAGSVEIGENTWIAPSSSILNGKKIGNGVTIGLGAVVRKDINDGEVWVGNPAVKLKKG